MGDAPALSLGCELPGEGLLRTLKPIPATKPKRKMRK
jgi:hypothetical protein